MTRRKGEQKKVQERLLKAKKKRIMMMTQKRDTVDVSPPIACHGGTWDSMFGLWRMQNSTVNARDSRFILVRALDRDRVITLRPVGVSLCVGLIVKCCVVLCVVSLGTPPSFI